MNPNTMMLDECQDWLRNYLYMKREHDTDCGSAWFRRTDGMYILNGTHDPVPPTLDEAAKLPEGWTWFRGWQPSKWHACRFGYAILMGVEMPDTGDERLDRFRLRVAVEMAMKGTKP